MRNIVIFSSGDGAAALRVISLFNEGNRFRVTAVVSPSYEVLEKVKSADPSVKLIRYDESLPFPEETEMDSADIIAVDAPDGFNFDPLTGRGDCKVVRLSSEEQAPLEIVAAANVETTPPPLPAADDAPKSVDEEWAETLHINFSQKEAGMTPPPIPGSGPQPEIPADNRPDWMKGNGSRQANSPQPGFNQQEPMPPSYLVLSVVMTVLCCLVPGIVAIVFSSQVSTKYYAGDLEGARRASQNAEIWIIVSFVLGLLSATLYLPIALIN